jgi:hypothetical protein
MSKQSSVLSFFKKSVKSSASVEEDTHLTKSNPCDSVSDELISCSHKYPSVQFEGESGDPSLGVQTANISKGPFQPIDCFKVSKVQSKSRQFKESWYKEFSWVEYSPIADAAFCYPCRLFCQCKTGRGEESFTKLGMNNWKKALEKLRKHEKSEMHLKANQFLNEYRKPGISVADALSSAHTKKVQTNRKYLKFIIETILFLGKQNLAFRGHDESLDSFNRGNFLELLELRSKLMDEEIRTLMKSAVHSYKSAQVQNEIIECIKNEMLHEIVKEVNEASAYSIICDETTDISSREQLSICIRYIVKVDGKIEIKERFLGFVNVFDTTGENLHQTIKKYLQQLGIVINKMHGQAYDGASNMSGKFKGVAARFQEEEPKALYTHCHAHLLDLAVMRFCEEIRQLRNCLSIVNNLYNIINASASRFSIFESICRQNGETKMKRLVSLSRTRWTVRHRAICAILDQLPEVYETLEVIANDTTNSKVAAEADGLAKQISTFEFLFSMKLLHNVLSQTDVLSKELQSESLDISKVFAKMESVIDCLKMDRNDDGFSRAWNEAEEQSNKYRYNMKGLSIEKPSLPRKRKIPKKLDASDCSEASLHKSLKQMFKIDIYFAGLDTVIANLQSRFSQNDYGKINNIAKLLLDWTNIDNKVILNIQKFYNLSASFSTQLKFFHSYANNNFVKTDKKKLKITFQELAKFFIENDLQENAPDVWKLVEISLSWPITTASAERSFSTLRRLKTYLRSTMKEDRLSGLALMAVEPEMTAQYMQEEKLNVLVDRFSNLNERRLMLH